MLNASPVPHERIAGNVAVRTDVYPAQVDFSFGTNPYRRARAIVTSDKVLVLVEAGSGPAVLYEGRLEDVVADGKQVVATTADGTVTIARQGGCGCGGTLRGYRPYGRAVRMAKVSA